MQLLRVFLILVFGLILESTRTVAGIDMALTLPSKFCIMERVKRMLGYNCSDLKLKEVPQYMKSGVEVMVLNENRIRDLSKESFRKYTDLRYLYLHENMIQTVEIGTFTQLNYLEVLDLSSNALTTLPLELFHLSTLRTLYAADNNLFQLAGHLEELYKPISAPLQIISLSACKLQSIPDFGLMPNLLHANFSLNPMTQLEPEQLAPMCNLKTIDLSGINMSGCVCQHVRSYLAATSVYIKNGPNYCENTANDCSTHPRSNTTEHLYTQCLASKAAQVQEERKSSILIYAAIGSACVGVLLLLCCCCIRNRKIKRRRKEQKKVAAERRRARKLKEAEQRLISPEKSSSPSNDGVSDRNSIKSNIIQVDIEKVPLGN